MSSNLRASLGWLTRSVPTVLVLAGLAALFVWGARTGWKLPSLAELRGKEKEKDPKKGDKKDDDDLLTPGSVSLSSDKDATGAGIETAPAKLEALNRAITAPAVLAFDQRRYAHLSARANGTAWRVLRDAGDSVKAG